MKHILIPTDFSVQSLNAVHTVVSNSQDTKLKITFLHLLDVSNDLHDLLFRPASSRYRSMITPEFTEACEILQNRYRSKIAGLKIELGFGNTKAYLENLLEGLGVDSIAICDDFELSLTSPKSIAMLPLLKRTGYPIMAVSSNEARNQHHDINVMSMTKSNELKPLKNELEYAAQK